MNPFTDIRAALFDLDGTLVETHIDFPLMKRECLALAARRGLDAEALASLDILTLVETARERLIAAGRPAEGDALRAEAFARLQDIEIEQCAHPVELEGASDLLADLRARGVKVGIVTRNCRAVSERLLAFARLDCDALVTRDDVPRTKPDPAHLTAALRGFPALSPSAVVMVGDHWMDVQAGRDAGMRTVGLLRGREAEFFAPAPPDLLVEEVGSLLSLWRITASDHTGGLAPSVRSVRAGLDGPLGSPDPA